ncbi:MAG: hypothetical protein CMC78_02400 [Flavobacteriaceae bacterium]|nr:hypothetical protein [Flavobacteriaceae bacterium]
MYEGLATLSSTVADVLKKKQDKHRSDREAQIKLDILTKGVSPELEATFRGERDLLFEDDLATQEFATKYEEETGDSITAQEFRNMAGWEKYMVAEQYALEKAKGYDQYVYDSYETMTVDLIRDGQEVRGLKYDDLQSPSEYAALDEKIKFEYARQFAGLNEALVATVVKPEIDKFDAARRKKQAIEREANYQATVKASDSRMISVGFSTANPGDGHQLAHDWAARYAARNRTTIGAGRTAFKENLVDLVSQNVITYPEAMSVVNHEIEARDGSTKTMGSWKEWSGLTGELADAAKQGTQAREEAKANNIAADLQVIRENKNLSNDGKAQLMAVYREKYDGYVPTELADALRGHLDDDVAEDMIEKSLRYNGGVYDYEMENVSTQIFNKYKDKIIASGAVNAGTEDYKKAQNLLKAYTNAGTGDTFGETDTKSEAWLTLYGNLEEIFNSTYKETYMQNGVIVSTPKDAFRAAQAAVKEVLDDDRAVKRLMVPELDPLDDSYSRRIQLNLEQASGGNWKKVKLATDVKSEQELLAWSQTPLKQSSDIPEYYRDLAMRMGVNPIDLANQQLKYYTEEEVKEDKKEQKYDDKVLELIYKFPTRSSITRARLEVEGAGEQNVKTSIYNKKALMRKDK